MQNNQIQPYLQMPVYSLSCISELLCCPRYPMMLSLVLCYGLGGGASPNFRYERGGGEQAMKKLTQSNLTFSKSDG